MNVKPITRGIVNYPPMHNGMTKVTKTDYNLGDGRVLTVDTVYMNNKKHVQAKTLSYLGKDFKEIVIEFVDGIRGNIIKVR